MARSNKNHSDIIRVDNTLVINDSNWRKFVSPVVSGEPKALGLMPRDYQANPYGSLEYADPYSLENIPEEEIPDRIADQERNRSSLEHLRTEQGIQSLDQDGYGYCWAFSTTKAVMFVRALQNQPMVPLSGWAVGAIVKNYRDQGGWCQQSLDFAVNVGIPSLQIWPQGKVQRSLDTPDMRADAATRKVTEWMELAPRSKLQLATCLLLNIPVMIDLNWWGHSVCAYRLISWNPFRVQIDNSWTPGWGDNGTAILEGSKAIPDNAACPRVSMAA